MGQTYQDEFSKLARRIAGMLKLSVIDQLASIYEPPAPVDIKKENTITLRRIAVERILARRNPTKEG
jgi:hypothetical protein